VSACDDIDEELTPAETLAWRRRQVAGMAGLIRYCATEGDDLSWMADALRSIATWTAEIADLEIRLGLQSETLR
jgi:hypothetical protein